MIKTYKPIITVIYAWCVFAVAVLWFPSNDTQKGVISSIEFNLMDTLFFISLMVVGWIGWVAANVDDFTKSHATKLFWPLLFSNAISLAVYFTNSHMQNSVNLALVPFLILFVYAEFRMCLLAYRFFRGRLPDGTIPAVVIQADTQASA